MVWEVRPRLRLHPLRDERSLLPHHKYGKRTDLIDLGAADLERFHRLPSVPDDFASSDTDAKALKSPFTEILHGSDSSEDNPHTSYLPSQLSLEEPDTCRRLPEYDPQSPYRHQGS